MLLSQERLLLLNLSGFQNRSNSQQNNKFQPKEKVFVLDSSNRLVQVFTPSDFNSSARQKASKVAQTFPKEGAEVPTLAKYDIVVIEDSDIMPNHAPAYIFPFLVGEILSNICASIRISISGW